MFKLHLSFDIGVDSAFKYIVEIRKIFKLEHFNIWSKTGSSKLK